MTKIIPVKKVAELPNYNRQVIIFETYGPGEKQLHTHSMCMLPLWNLWTTPGWIGEDADHRCSPHLMIFVGTSNGDPIEISIPTGLPRHFQEDIVKMLGRFIGDSNAQAVFAGEAFTEMEFTDELRLKWKEAFQLVGTMSRDVDRLLAS